MHRTLPRPPRPFRIDGVLFDFDGTLTLPEGLDFPAIKREVGCPPDEYVLEFVQALPAGERRDEAFAVIERFELEGAARAEPNAGAEDTVHRLRRSGLKTGVITRNGRTAIERALRNFRDLSVDDFDVIITRDDPYPPKPAPDGVLGAAAALGVDPTHVLLVGDFLLDALAGRRAGAVTAFLTNGAPADARRPAEALVPAADGSPRAAADVESDPPPGSGCAEHAACDFVITTLAELQTIVRLGAPLAQGKLPPDLLATYFEQLDKSDPAVLVGAAFGEDVAALDISSHEVLVIHGDPITLTTADLGRHAVTVNANDVATSGAEPRWLLATVLLPAGTTAAEALYLLGGIATACREQGIAAIGGHTEVTAAVTQPVVSLTILGVLRRADLRAKSDAREGDRVVLTKALAAEGTALLAVELRERLLDLGMTEDELERCRSLATLLSIVPEARIAAGFAGVRAMHDVTESGLATALLELSVACGREIDVDRDAVPVFRATERLCTVLGADPFGLIGSGSLLICCAPGETAALVAALTGAGIAATEIGTVGRPGAGVTARASGRPVPWPTFTVDEAARLLAE